VVSKRNQVVDPDGPCDVYRSNGLARRCLSTLCGHCQRRSDSLDGVAQQDQCDGVPSLCIICKLSSLRPTLVESQPQFNII